MDSTDTIDFYGESSSAGRALDCGSRGRGFKSRLSPFCLCSADAGTASAAESRRIAHGEGLLPRLSEMQFNDVFVV
jgi:hypothetical protein